MNYLPFHYHTVCPKCGCPKLKRPYAPPRYVEDTNGQMWRFDEHLACVCPACGYSWGEHTADHLLRTRPLSEADLATGPLAENEVN